MEAAEVKSWDRLEVAFSHQVLLVERWSFWKGRRDSHLQGSKKEMKEYQYPRPRQVDPQGELVYFYDGCDPVHIWGLKFRKDEHI